MSSLAELDEAVELMRGQGSQIAMLQCTTAYPCPPEQIGLEQMEILSNRYECPVGLSDHSGTIYAGLAAVTLGASLLEVHVTFSRQTFGPDVPASITLEELSELVAGTRFIECALGSRVDKDADVAKMKKLRTTFGKSIFVNEDLPAGTVLCKRHLSAKKPGTGIPASEYREVLGRRLQRSVAANEPLSKDALE
jgi:N,N'-diacetyllegionaminate synthase